MYSIVKICEKTQAKEIYLVKLNWGVLAEYLLSSVSS